MTGPRGSSSAPSRGGAQTLREQQKEATHKRLLDAAVEVFVRDGYSTSRVEDIARAAGVGRATFYLHFAGKLDVVHELIGPLRARSEALYRELDTHGDPSWSQLHEWITHVIDYWRRNRAAITVVNQAVGVEAQFASYFVDAASASAQAMTSFLASRPPAEREQARLRITMFILQLERVCYFWIIRGVPFDPDATLTALTDSFHTALHPNRS